MKQETLEEVAERLYPHKPFWIGSGKSARLYDEFKTQRDSFIDGAKWQTERSYSEEEVRRIAEWSFHFHKTNDYSDSELADEWELRLEKMFKKK